VSSTEVDDIKILLVDDQPATRLGIQDLLRSVEGVEIVGEAVSSEEAVRLNEKLRPDLVILDPSLEGEMSEAEICRELKSSQSPPRVLIYSGRNSREDVAVASLAGADSYLYKGLAAERLAEVVERTCSGQKVWLLGPVESDQENDFRSKIDGAGLTPKEREILALLMKRHTNQEIAEEFHLSANTVKTHVKNILKELHFSSRSELFKVD
jgi:DNA-binding NarL/FixJ family response regulator